MSQHCRSAFYCRNIKFLQSCHCCCSGGSSSSFISSVPSSICSRGMVSTLHLDLEGPAPLSSPSSADDEMADEGNDSGNVGKAGGDYDVGNEGDVLDFGNAGKVREVEDAIKVMLGI